MKNIVNMLFLETLITRGFLLSAESILNSCYETTGIDGTPRISVGHFFNNQLSIKPDSLRQGAQQTYVISTFIEDKDNLIQLEILAYPNSTKDYLNLTVDGQGSKKLQFRMLNLKGQVLENGSANNGTSINVQKYASSTYIIQILESKKMIKSFRIIKN